MLRFLIPPVLLTMFLGAQEVNSTAYVQESLIGAAGNAVPFGCLSNGQFAESRTQILIPAWLLPGPGATLVGIALQGQTSTGGSGTLVYPFLGVLVSPVGLGATLSPTFATNLPSLRVMLNATNLAVPWQANAWTTIPFGVSYVHDGRSSLVIDVQKIVTPTLDLTTRTIQNAGRSELPRMINSFGNPGSGAHLAPVASATTNYAPTLKLLWSNAPNQQFPTLRLRSDPAANNSLPFAIGRTITHTVEGTPGAFTAQLAAFGLHLRSVSFPPLVGLVWLSNAFTFGSGVMPASGEIVTTIPIPNQPALIGTYIAFQSVTVDHATAPWRVTNVADCLLH